MTVAPVQTQTSVASRRIEDVYIDLLDNTPLFVLDVRNEDDFARWGIDGRDNLEVVNIPYFEFIEDEDGSIAKVPADRDILVVCAKEGSSQYVAELLAERGINATYLQDGIMSWGNYYDERIILDEEFGRIVQISRPARGDLSFLILSDGKAAIIDPLRHVENYVEPITDAGAELSYIFDTHVHADHISGGPALARETGAPYYMHPYDGIHPLDMLPAAFDYEQLDDGDTFELGQFTIETVWFPGHTLGQVNYLLTDPNGGTYLFTGDGIFLKSFGRPDLGGKGEAWTPILYESLFERLPKHVNDDTLILPAHFSVLDEGDDEGRFAESYGVVKQQNEALVERSLEEFTDFVLSRLPTFPEEYVEIKRVNIGISEPTEEEASELELGKNICALSE